MIDLMGLDLPVPDHTTLSRRAQKQPTRILSSLPDGPLHVLADSTGLKVYGAGQWLQDKHGAKSRRNWRKLHLAVDADSGRIVGHTLTDQDTDGGCHINSVKRYFHRAAPILDALTL